MFLCCQTSFRKVEVMSRASVPKHFCPFFFFLSIICSHSSTSAWAESGYVVTELRAAEFKSEPLQGFYLLLITHRPYQFKTSEGQGGQGTIIHTCMCRVHLGNSSKSGSE